MRACILFLLTSVLAAAIVPAAPTDPASLRNRAAAFLDNGDDARALEIFRGLVRRYPSSVPDRVNLGIALLNGGDLDGAEAELRKSLELDSGDLRARYNLAIVLKRKGGNEEAAAILAAIAATPGGREDASVHYNLGILYKRLRKGEGALTAFRRTVEIRPEHASAHFQIYNELVQRGEKSKAQPELEQFKILQKATPEFQRTEAYLERGSFTKIDAPGPQPAGGRSQGTTQPKEGGGVAVRFELGHAVGTAPPASPAKGSSGTMLRGMGSVLADFDGDGSLDLAFASTGSETVQIVRQKSAGLFATTLSTVDLRGWQEPVASPTGSKSPGSAAQRAEASERRRLALAAGDADNDGDLDIALAALGGGVRLLRNDGKGRMTDETSGSGLENVPGGPEAAWFDSDRDGDLDLVLAGGLEVRGAVEKALPPRLYLNASLSMAVAPPPASANNKKSMQAPSALPKFIKADEEAALPPCGIAIAFADLRGRDDADLVFLCQDGMVQIARNMRAGRFKPADPRDLLPPAPAGDLLGRWPCGDATGGQARPAGASMDTSVPPSSQSEGREVRAADLDGDGWSDLVVLSRRSLSVAWNDGAGILGKPTPIMAAPPVSPSGLAILDVDGDGDLDVATVLAGGGSRLSSAQPQGRLLVLQNEGSKRFRTVCDASGAFPAGESVLLAGDVDGDADPDLVVVSSPSAPPVVLLNATKSPNRFIKIDLAGVKSNRFGVGAKIEIRSDRFATHLESNGSPTVIGVGPRGRVDAVRIVWPTGISQDVVDVPSGTLRVQEKREFAGSCPFLYAWDGSTFRFVGEALSGAPVGFLRPDGTFEKPKPLEHFRLPPGLPAEHKGRLSLRLTEEMRELTALDQVRLVAVDHPIGTEVYSNERIREAGEEPFRFIALAGLHPPDAAAELSLSGASFETSAAPRSVSLHETLSRLDDSAASAFSMLGARLEGLAEPHALVLRFEVRSGSAGHLWESALALVLDGWVSWMTSDVSRALLQSKVAREEASAWKARDKDDPAGPSFAGRPIPASPEPWGPALEMRSGNRTAFEPDLGLPIGPSMIAQLPEGPEPGRILEIRIGSNLGVYYDRIRLGRIVDVSLTVRELAPVAAELRWRGVASHRRHEDSRPPRPDYDDVSPSSPFRRLPEPTTREGDVLSLVNEGDDLFAIFGTGEEIAIEFDGSSVPRPAAGFTRTWFLVSRGYARDGDPNTEPLPWGSSVRERGSGQGM